MADLIVNSKTTEQQVKEANRQFYDALANSYEEIDGRRTIGLERWLRENLTSIRFECSGYSLLDIGAGSGLVTRCAKGIFKKCIGIDISSRILSAHSKFFDYGVAADVKNLPFASQTFDAVTCFSVLHHLYNFNELAVEVKRVLKPGGVFYSDHDLDGWFGSRFDIPLTIYRKFRNPAVKYQRFSRCLTPELYALTEWQAKGVDSDLLVSLFEKEGFSVAHHFHWYGLTVLTDFVFKKKHYPWGWAPLFSMRAVKTCNATL